MRLQSKKLSVHHFKPSRYRLYAFTKQKTSLLSRLYFLLHNSKLTIVWLATLLNKNFQL